MDKPVLQVDNLSVRFGSETVVDDVGFTINKGETLALVGESGSGKSITAFSIMRLLPGAADVDSGRVHFDGRDIFALPEYEMRTVRGKGIAMIFQEPMTALNPVLTIGQQIEENLPPGLSRAQRRERVLQLLRQVEIPEPERLIEEYPHRFSGGMRQRVVIAAALAGEPKVLIADEPTTALDVTIQARILDLLKSLQQRTGAALLFITHDLALVKRMADQVVVMQGGKVVERNSRAQFFAAPRHEYSKKLFQVIPSLERRGERLSGTEAPARPRPAGEGSTVLAVQDMKVHFPIQKGIFKRTVGWVKAVDGVTLQLQAGRTLALVGESGSGKTTIGKSILQLIRPTGGSVRLEQHELTALKGRALRENRAPVQIVFQDPFSSLNPRMLVGDIIEEGMRAQRIEPDAQARRARVQSLLDRVGLPVGSINRYPHEFSGGQRQRIGIARALAVNPRVIVCDEPTSALDVSVQAQILDLLKDLQAEFGLSYLFITHDFGVVGYMAHEVAVLNQGRIIEHGPTETVLTRPREDYTQRLLAAVPEV